LHDGVKRETEAAESLPVCEVRPRTEVDLDACVRVLAEVHERDGYPVNWPETPRGWLARPSQLAAWVAELDGGIVGHLALAPAGQDDLAPALWSRRAGTDAERTAVISRLYVSPSARGHRIGALLMSQAVKEARERGLHPVLDVVASDTAAVTLYERLRWTLLAVVDQQWAPGRQVTIRCYAAPPR
jgi:GNAT superfamily N-acetyltransferase